MDQTSLARVLNACQRIRFKRVLTKLAKSTFFI